ncbi:MAG TPA: glycosyltransferase family 39 protein [Candidatus Bathyarchaeia archaeon]|nr:glycosyltransferase family 39 protein [Candidatus Bathyarchaeia archaeon]
MSKKDRFHKTALFVTLLLGAFFRFYRLDWGEGLFFHPDENNIASSISQLKPPDFHPHFFAYGHFPIYWVYLTKQLPNLINHFSLSPVSFPEAISSLRLWAAFASTLTIWVVYLIGQRVFNKQYGLLAAILTSFIPGLIQASHFGTTESVLTLLFFTTLYHSLELLKKTPNKKIFLFLAIILGIGLSTKLNALVFFSFPFIALLEANFSLKKIWRQKKLFLLLSISLLGAFLVSFLTSPYQVLDFSEFWRVAQYEINVARGKIPVFYTRQFINTQPVIFQLVQIFPFSLNPFMEITGLLGLFLTLINIIRKRIRKQPEKILLIWAFASYFTTSGLIFAKWTRFVTPLLPFFVIFSLEIIEFFENRIQVKFRQQSDSARYQSKKIIIFRNAFIILLITVSFIYGLAFFSIYLQPDIRITASEWMRDNLPPESKILSEGGNVVDIPLKGNFRVVNLDFYNLDQEKVLFDKLFDTLADSQYLLIPSRRIFADHPAGQYPKVACYYRLLFSDRLGYAKIKEFTSYPSIDMYDWKWEIPDELAEETWSVFDHPVIRLYKKTLFYSEKKYKDLLNLCLNINFIK